MGIMPRTRRLRVAGIFRLGLYEFDATYGFVSLPLAARLLDRNPDLIELRVQNFYDAPVIARGLASDARPGLLGAGLGRHEQVAVPRPSGWRRWPSRSPSA